MIFRTSCPVFQSQAVLNGKHDLSIGFQMSGNDLQEIHIRILALNIGLPVFKYTDQCNIIIFLSKVFFDLLEISHKDLQVILISVPVGVDPASFHGKFNTGHFFRLPAECTCNSATAGTDLQHLFFPCKRKPA